MNQVQPVIHDRRATELPSNAQVRPLVVDDPYEAGAKIVAFQSLRGDTLANLHARGHIDDAQYQAGRELQRFYEHSEIGGVKAMDPTKEAVDGGGIYETLTEQVQRAIQEVARVEKVLGHEGSALARDVLCYGLTLQQCAQARNLFSETGIKYIGKRFREVLESAAIELGFVGAR